MNTSLLKRSALLLIDMIDSYEDACKDLKELTENTPNYYKMLAPTGEYDKDVAALKQRIRLKKQDIRIQLTLFK